MSIIYIRNEIKQLGNFHDFWEFRYIAIHRKYTIGDDHDFLVFSGLPCLPRFGSQVIHIGVVVADHR
ncbi:hypothetical protein D3C73_933550 [compost metagenome]